MTQHFIYNEAIKSKDFYSLYGLLWITYNLS